MRLSSRWGPCWSRYICHGRWSTVRGFGRLLLWCREWILPRQPRSVPVLASKNYVVQLWPNITILAFQIFSSPFTDHGRCLNSGKGLILALSILYTISYVVFSLTGKGFINSDKRLHYGVVTPKGFYILNGTKRRLERGHQEHEQVSAFAVLTFLRTAFCDVRFQKCFFTNTRPRARQLLLNLPRGTRISLAIISIIFPTSRNGIRYWYDAFT